LDSATALAGDRFIAYSTWKWADSQLMSGAPVYRYFYARPRPAMKAAMGNASAGLAGGVVRNSTAPPAPPARGAVHSAEIEYALGNLAKNDVYEWTPDDYKVSQVMQAYFANFIKTKDPNGPGLPKWPTLSRNSGEAAPQIMRIDVETRAEPDKYRARYRFQDEVSTKSNQ
jgi:para-nitrobenzyl esterase